MSDAPTDALTHPDALFLYYPLRAYACARTRALWRLWKVRQGASVRQVRQPSIPLAMTDTLTRLVRRSRWLRVVIG